MAHKNWQKQSSKYVLSNPWYKVRQDEVIRPDGHSATYNVVECNESVFIVPITADGKIILVRLFRYTTQHKGWEVPAGGIENDEASLVAAKRELKEETGLTSTTWKEVCKFDLMNGISDAEAYVFEAKNLSATMYNEQAEEGITDMQEFTPAQVIEMIQKGEIVDALSVAALMQVFSAHGMVNGTL